MSTQSGIPTIRLLLLGEYSVGKTSLVLRFADDEFFQENIPTIGVDFKLKIIEIERTKEKVLIWETSVQEKLRNIPKSYYQGVEGILVVFDVSERVIFNFVQYWIDSIKELSTNDVNVVLIGNKIDLEKKVTQEEASSFAKSYNIPYCETSAKTSINVDDVFIDLSKTIYDRIKKSPQSHVKSIKTTKKIHQDVIVKGSVLFFKIFKFS